MNNNASIDALEQGGPLSVALTPQRLAVPDGWKLVPVEPTPEIIAGAAIASWPTAALADIDLARQAAPLVLMQMEMAPGTTVDALAGMLATMAPAYRAMIAAAPVPPAEELAAAQGDIKDEKADLVRAGLALIVNLKTVKDELETLKGDAKDAERYRWLRQFPTNFATDVWGVYGAGLPLDKTFINQGERLDSAIDAAIAAKAAS
ncbi:hypothetical protein [Janthinobacterium violaceinigrum]|uniref:Uncharacterized protein n=1 Tax=Janthinobacterium violaceinigrum TaxID=2654252 RepID=A0A6I1I5J2_9BURK|nr:hypothetical protein [Janthinobacterium violaceinigrum]KAB8066222.1 hypothetical protein GCN75_03205 [Janthinobacterium violaceinigrum]